MTENEIRAAIVGDEKRPNVAEKTAILPVHRPEKCSVIVRTH